MLFVSTIWLYTVQINEDWDSIFSHYTKMQIQNICFCAVDTTILQSYQWVSAATHGILVIFTGSNHNSLKWSENISDNIHQREPPVTDAIFQKIYLTGAHHQGAMVMFFNYKFLHIFHLHIQWMIGAMTTRMDINKELCQLLYAIPLVNSWWQ